MKKEFYTISATFAAMKKSARCLLAFVLMTFCALPTMAQVVGDQFTEDGITYEVINADVSNLQVTVLKAPAGEVTIPSTVVHNSDKTFTITRIGKSEATCNFENVTKITLPETLKEIYTGAFRYSIITELEIPASLTTWQPGVAYLLPSTLTKFVVEAGNGSFTTDDDILYSADMKTLIAVPQGKDMGADGIFTVPNTVETIQINAFSKNRYYTGATAFLRNLTNPLRKLIIPASVTTIGTAGYSIVPWCTNLAEVVVDPDNQKYKSIDGVVFNKEGTDLVSFPPGKGYENTSSQVSYTVPDGVTTISQYAFFSARITEIDLNQVATFGTRAVAQCDRLKTIYLSDYQTEAGLHDNTFDFDTNIEGYYTKDGTTNWYSDNGVLYNGSKTRIIKYPAARPGDEYEILGTTETISASAFMDVKYLKKIDVPDAVTSIGMYAFRNMKELEEINFSDNSQLKTMGATLFWSSPNLKKIIIPASVTTFVAAGTASTFTLSQLETIIIKGGSQLTSLPALLCNDLTTLKEFKFDGSADKITSIGEKAFYNCTALESFAIPKNVASIGNLAFGNTEKLKTITFDESSVLTTIASGAFADCGVTSISLPASVTTIQQEAFRNCTALDIVNFDAGIQTVHPRAFQGCENLKHLNVPRENETYSSVDGMLLTKNKETLVIFPAGKASHDFTLMAPSIKTIGEYAFYANKKLTNITIPNLVTKIGDRAFGLCNQLNTITFLCDAMIEPSNISQGLNISSFDDDQVGGTVTDNRKNIKIYVRAGTIAENYKNNDFYKKFGGIGTSFTFERVAGYPEEFIPVSKNAVDMLSARSENYTYILPKTIPNPEGGEPYSVDLLGDYAFDGASDAIKEVIVPRNLTYIGARAFMTDHVNKTSTINRVFILDPLVDAETFSVTRFLLDDTGNDYAEFANTTTVYVKKSVFKSDAFKAAVKSYTEDAYPYGKTDAASLVRAGNANMFQYQIKEDIAINSTRYGTFSREFDVDLSDYYNDNHAGRVYAFTVTDGKFIPGKGDGVVDGTYLMRFHSIGTGDGTYIPAGTGVLLKTMDGASSTPGEYHYTIGEDDVNERDNTSWLEPMTEKARTIQPTVSGSQCYIMSGGLFKALASPKLIPVHKAYLVAHGMPAGAKPMFMDPEDETTLIENIFDDADNTNADGTMYDLQGRKVIGKPTKGVYIVNGKKTVIK